jgi:hypothetical protein
MRWQLATDDIHWVNVVGKAEIAPKVSRAAVLRDPAIASGIGQFGAVPGVSAIALSKDGPREAARRPIGG